PSFSCIDPPTTEIYTLSLHDALPISSFGNDLIVNKNGWVDPSSIIASYPFQPDLALNNLIAVYRKYPSLFWGEYGFRIMDLKKKDRKSTRLNSSHVKISYAVFCLKKK